MSTREILKRDGQEILPSAAEALAARVQGSLRDAGQAVRRYAGERPLQALVLAVATGYLLGKIVRRAW